MKCFLCAVLINLVVAFGASAQVTLNGTVQEDAEKVVVVPNTKVVVNGSYSGTTDSNGVFSIKLSRDLIQGERVIIKVDRKDWVINRPVDGEWNLPTIAYQNEQITKVIIVPNGSMKFWSNERIAKYVAKLSDDLARQKKEGNKPKPVDFTTYLDQYARAFGFTLQQVREAFDQWAKRAEGSEDKETRALAEYYRKNFLTASRLFDEAALEKRKKREDLALEEYEVWKNSGNSLFMAYHFAEALDRYREAQKLVSKERFPAEWTTIRMYLGYAKLNLGERAEGESGNVILQEAFRDYNEALEVLTREKTPGGWALTIIGMARTLEAQGARTAGPGGDRFLAYAAILYQLALEVYARKDFPQEWAETQAGLGGALSSRGLRTAGPERAELLAAAINAYQSALEVYAPKDFPQEWATMHMNLGTALGAQGLLVGGDEGKKLLRDALASYEKALSILTQDDFPQQWSIVQRGRTLVLEILCSDFNECGM